MPALTLHPQTTALVLIDLQHGIVSRPLQPHAPADVVARSAQLANAFRAAGALVVPVHVAFGPGPVSFPRGTVDEPMQRPATIPDNFATIVPELNVSTNDLVITKRQWGAFHGTELDAQLRRRGVTTIVLGGIATNFGVESTARAAWEHNYDLILVEDAMTSFTADAHNFAVKAIFPRLGRVVSTADVLAAIPKS